MSENAIGLGTGSWYLHTQGVKEGIQDKAPPRCQHTPWADVPCLGHDGGLRAWPSKAMDTSKAMDPPVFLEGAHAGEGRRGEVAQRARSVAVEGNGLQRGKGHPSQPTQDTQY